MTTDDFTDVLHEETQTRYHREAGTARGAVVSAFKAGALWARDHLAAQEPTDAEVEAAANAILAFEGETEETAHGDLYDAAWDHARAALAAARAVRQEKR